MSQATSCPCRPAVKCQNRKGALSLPPTAALEANQKLDSGSVWDLDKAQSVEGSVHVCPEGRMGEDLRILLELVLGKNVGGAPWSGAGGKQISGKRDSAN